MLNNITHITHTCIVLRKVLLIYIRMITINIQRSLATPHNFMPALIPFLSIQHLRKNYAIDSNFCKIIYLQSRINDLMLKLYTALYQS